ncbi:hypothetical protein EPI10_031728 [Gossypium australe]|uniref:Uncharacterized protein n=1 Tax=Gossypium australe TaxID=47621 RepID=A0A5B6X4W4_9ROSI|nr:hypothetical protein EPI10_031728 [Gossypium australe]
MDGEEIVMDTNVTSLAVKSIRMVKDFLNVFLEELPQLPQTERWRLGLKFYERLHRCPLLLIVWHRRS